MRFQKINFSDWLKKIEPVGLTLALGFFLVHFWILIKHTVDFPKYDDWILIKLEWMKPLPSLHWLLDQVVEHRLTVHKFIHWLLYRLGVRDYSVIEYINFFSYGVMAFSIWWILKKRNASSEAAIWFLPFLF